MKHLIQKLPLTYWLANYNRSTFSSDFVASMIVTVMLIPQSLAYALLAGLPPQHGLYASIIPLVVYSLLGSSSTLAVGPVAIASIMTASALAGVTQAGIIGYVEGAILLAFMSGLILTVFGLFRFGFIANFLSHAVVTGFITASALLIALSQTKHILGVSTSDKPFIELLYELAQLIPEANRETLAIGLGSILFLIMSRRYTAVFLKRCGLNNTLTLLSARLAPIIAVIVTTLMTGIWSLNDKGVAIVGHIPEGLAVISLPSWNIEAFKMLALPAFFIAIIGYVESISVARTLAAPRHEKIHSNQELIALGSANIAAGFAGGFPVAGSFSRSVINFDAGSQTPVSGIFTAIFIGIACFTLTEYLYYLPIALLAATIIVAVLSLVDFSVLKEAWSFSKSDFHAALLTILLTLIYGVETGVATGIIASIMLHLYHTSKPYVAEIGLVHDTHHFRNIHHYDTETVPHVVSLRIDQSFIFSNVQFIEDYIDSLIVTRPEVKHIILHCGAINTIDLSGLELLHSLNHKLAQAGITLNFAELKTPLRLKLEHTSFLKALNGKLYLTQHDAYIDRKNDSHTGFIKN